jgi:predicted metalloendopeptidase
VVVTFHHATLTAITFPAAILQPPLFDPQSDDGANFGAIGAIIGHELAHGFDDQGRKFDGEGNLHDWWPAEDGKEFDKREQCVADEYSGFEATEGCETQRQPYLRREHCGQRRLADCFHGFWRALFPEKTAPGQIGMDIPRSKDSS